MYAYFEIPARSAEDRIGEVSFEPLESSDGRLLMLCYPTELKLGVMYGRIGSNLRTNSALKCIFKVELSSPDSRSNKFTSSMSFKIAHSAQWREPHIRSLEAAINHVLQQYDWSTRSAGLINSLHRDKLSCHDTYIKNSDYVDTCRYLISKIAYQKMGLRTSCNE